MSYPVYYVETGDTLPIMFHTFDGGTGASMTMTGLAVTDIEIYKDGSVTQRASDAGYTLLDTDGIDLDGITGIHGFSIDLSDNTDAGFYAVGPWYHVIVSAVTVDAQTVNFIAAAFRIVSATRGMAGTALPDAAADAAGGLVISDAGGLDIDTKLAATNEVTAARMGALTDLIDGGRLDLLIDGIKTKTDGLNFTGTDVKATLDSEEVTPTAASKTGYSLAADQSAVTIGTVSAVTGLTAANLDVAVSTRLATAGYTAPPSVGAIADQVWDEAMADHVAAGSTGASLNGAGSAGDPWTTTLPGAYGAGTAGHILGTNLDATVSGVPTVAEFEARTMATADYATAASQTTIAGYIDTEVGAIKTVTDALTAAAAAKLALSAGTMVVGSAITGTLSTTQMSTDLTEATDDHYNGRIVIFTSGVLTAQATDITAYNGTTKVVTMTALTEAPSNGDDFVIV